MAYREQRDVSRSRQRLDPQDAVNVPITGKCRNGEEIDRGSQTDMTRANRYKWDEPVPRKTPLSNPQHSPK